MLIALGAWVFTQFHLILSVKRIKEDIDAKRTATEAFVDGRLNRVEEVVGGFEGRMTAQMPPNLHGEIEEVREEIEEINTGLRKEFEALPGRIQAQVMAENSAQARQMMIAAKDLNEGLKDELAAVNAGLPPEMQQMDIRGKILKAIAREPTAKERKDMGVVGELLWTAGRAKMAEWLQSTGGPGSTVTYRVSQTGSEEM